MEQNDKIEEMLEYIQASSLDYKDWLVVGMALKEEGYDIEAWDRWSANDPDRYDPDDLAAKWDSFQRHDVTGATITQMAKERGWSPEKKVSVYMFGEDKYKKTFIWGDGTDEAEQKPKFTEPSKWNPVKDLTKYLEVMFDPNDIIGYTMRSYEKEPGKFVPRDKGSYTNTMGQLMDMLKGGSPIEKVFGSYDKKGGAWIRLNPLNGQGVDDKNVIQYKNLLVECDNMPIEEQIEALDKIQLPIKALVYSGGKSVHAIVPVNANSETEYRFEFNFIKNILHDAGMDIDTSNINPSRLTRLPGVTRNGHKQFLIKTNIGMESYEVWKEWVSALNDGLPDIENLADVWEDMPPLKPELIQGILRQSHKMIIASTSKAGKTFILMELAMAIAEGMNWIGHRCAQGKVLYINMELDRASFFHRFKSIYDAFGMDKGNHVENIKVWNLRGNSRPLQELAPKIIGRMKAEGYKAVMIDPLYKVMDGDENSNSDVARMVASFDKIAEDTGAAVIYAHHFAKGSSASKSIIDRAAGAGTFARDPDAILTMTQLDWSPEIESQDGWTAWRMESTLREFKAIDPVDLYFDWPIHRVDYDGRLAECELLSNENNKRTKIELKEQKSVVEQIVEQCQTQTIDEYRCFMISEFKKINAQMPKPIAEGSVVSRIKEAGYESVKRGFWGKIEEPTENE